MRDAHRIKERSAFADVLGASVRRLRTLFLLALAFLAGRMSAPREATLPALVSAVDLRDPPPLAPQAKDAPAPLTPPNATAQKMGREHYKERKQKSLIVNPHPQALSDGLLPEQLGSPRPGEYSVQVASFASRQEARAFCQQLTRRGFHPHVAELRPSSQPHRVRLGRFARRDNAHAYRGMLAQADITASVVQVD